MKLRYTKRAAHQIDTALDYIAKHSPQGAIRVRERLLALLVVLQEHPHTGHVTSRVGVRRIGLTPFPYLIDYRVGGDEVVIQRFRHMARKST